jgi:hypothetical protein
MRKQRSGLLITISSTAGISGQLFCTAYAAAKFGVEGWMDAYFAQGRPPIHDKTVHGFTPCRSSAHEVGRAQLSIRDDDSSTAYFDIS